MNILVTGANGQLGNEMRLVAQNSMEHYIFTDINQIEWADTVFLDITDYSAIRAVVEQYRVQAIVNCAAYTNVEAAEDNEELAEKLNATAPSHLARAMKEVNGLLVQISTDYVFGKEPYNTPCNEEQNGTPTGIYGLTKLHGEQKIKASGCKHVILRTAWLYSEFGKNFCKTMLQLTASHPELKVVFDQTGTPTYAWDLAQAIDVILQDYSKEMENDIYSQQGIYHFSNEGVCSWYDFTQMIASHSGHTACHIQPCHSSEYPSKVIRPAYSVLDKTKIKQVFGIHIPYWNDSLKTCINNILYGMSTHSH